jgi:NADPH:quinone reductase-like Zn-dependent oxidoreductase
VTIWDLLQRGPGVEEGGVKMKAIVCTKYGPPEVLKLQEVEKPIPKKNEICIKIHVTTATSSDCILRGFNIPMWHPVGLMMGIFMGFGKPRNPILGMVAAGEVESMGTDAKRFKIGDQVIAYPVLSPTKIRLGTYAQYICVPEDWPVIPIPSNVSYEEAAAIPYGGELAMHFLKKGDIQNRKNVLIVGASGTIGTTALQIARHYGAKVTGVCSTGNIELVKSLGAETVIDYTKEDYSKRSERYDLILDAVPQQVADRKGLKSQGMSALAPDGKYISIDDGLAKVSIDSLVLLKDLAASGEFKPVIDRTYPLEEMVEAHRYVESGHKKGNVIITIDHDE